MEMQKDAELWSGCISGAFLEKEFMPSIGADVIGRGLDVTDGGVDNRQLVQINDALRNHSVEVVGKKLRGYMTGMKAIV